MITAAFQRCPEALTHMRARIEAKKTALLMQRYLMNKAKLETLPCSEMNFRQHTKYAIRLNFQILT
jgi:hypothetical protein